MLTNSSLGYESDRASHYRWLSPSTLSVFCLSLAIIIVLGFYPTKK